MTDDKPAHHVARLHLLQFDYLLLIHCRSRHPARAHAHTDTRAHRHTQAHTHTHTHTHISLRTAQRRGWVGASFQQSPRCPEFANIDQRCRPIMFMRELQFNMFTEGIVQPQDRGVPAMSLERTHVKACQSSLHMPPFRHATSCSHGELAPQRLSRDRCSLWMLPRI